MDSIYAGAFQIITSVYDIKIDFIKTEPVPNDTGDVMEEERTLGQRITLPLPLAKQLVEKLNRQIEGYEERFGAIQTVPEATKAEE